MKYEVLYMYTPTHFDANKPGMKIAFGRHSIHSIFRWTHYFVIVVPQVYFVYMNRREYNVEWCIFPYH